MWQTTGNNRFPITGFLADDTDPQFCLLDENGENVFLKQIREAVNERRKAVFDNVPHHGIDIVDWTAMFGVPIDPEYDYTDEMKQSAVKMFDFYHEKILELGKYFCLIGEDVIGGNNANPDIVFLDSLQKFVTASAKIGNYVSGGATVADWQIGGLVLGGPDSGKYGWTIIPARLNPLCSTESLYAETFAEGKTFLDSENIPVILCAEMFNEMHNALNMMLLLTPAEYVDSKNWAVNVDDSKSGNSAGYAASRPIADDAVSNIGDSSYDDFDYPNGADIVIIIGYSSYSNGYTNMHGNYSQQTFDDLHRPGLNWWVLIADFKEYDSGDVQSGKLLKELYAADRKSLSSSDTGEYNYDGFYFTNGRKKTLLFYNKQTDFSYQKDANDFYD